MIVSDGKAIGYFGFFGTLILHMLLSLNEMEYRTIRHSQSTSHRD